MKEWREVAINTIIPSLEEFDNRFGGLNPPHLKSFEKNGQREAVSSLSGHVLGNVRPVCRPPFF